MIRKGILLAGGMATRLFPLTISVSKQLLPVYNKPMVYYPLSVLMLAGIRDILIITTPHDQDLYRRLLRDGDQWGLRFTYAVQPRPEGLAQSFLIGKEFLNNEGCALVLGDNIYYGGGLPRRLQTAARETDGATVFACRVTNPSAYGVVELDPSGRPLRIEEKPAAPASPFAVTGLYFYDANVVEYASSLQPSKRGELEITDINNLYLKNGRLKVEILGRGIAWFDAGTPDALLEAGNFVETIEKRQGLMIASPEEIAYRMGFIGWEMLKATARLYEGSRYAAYLLGIEHPVE